MEVPSLLERVSNVFYDASVFWGIPLVLALLYECYRELYGGKRR